LGPIALAERFSGHAGARLWMSLEQHSEAAQLRIGLRKPNDLSAWLNRLAGIRTSLSVSGSSRLMRESGQPKWQISRDAGSVVEEKPQFQQNAEMRSGSLLSSEPLLRSAPSSGGTEGCACAQPRASQVRSRN